MRKMSFLINKKLATISDGVKRVRNDLHIKKSKHYFAKILTKEFIKKNTTKHSRNMLRILNENKIILVVDGTLLLTQKPSKLNFCVANVWNEKKSH